MYPSQLPFVDLLRSLHAYRGDDAYRDILEPWPAAHADECRWITNLQERTNVDWAAAAVEDRCRLYAIFRVTSTLLLGFQSGRADGTDYQGPSLTLDDFQRFHERLGFQVSDVLEFHPFFHEIIAVAPDISHAAPIQITDVAWPCLMLGDLLFCRAGCTVTGGAGQVIPVIAGSSRLYWTYRRKDRACSDLSHGWGSNSQWRTAFRRDYRTPGRYHFNVDGRESLNEMTGSVEGLPREAMIELVRNRCFIKSSCDDSDLHPYNYAFTEHA